MRQNDWGFQDNLRGLPRKSGYQMDMLNIFLADLSDMLGIEYRKMPEDVFQSYDRRQVWVKDLIDRVQETVHPVLGIK